MLTSFQDDTLTWRYKQTLGLGLSALDTSNTDSCVDQVLNQAFIV